MAGATLQRMQHLPFIPLKLHGNALCEVHNHLCTCQLHHSYGTKALQSYLCFSTLPTADRTNVPMSSRERSLQKPSTQTTQLTEARLVLTHTNRLNPLSLCTSTELQTSYESVPSMKVVPRRGTITPKIRCF